MTLLFDLPCDGLTPISQSHLAISFRKVCATRSCRYTRAVFVYVRQELIFFSFIIFIGGRFATLCPHYPCAPRILHTYSSSIQPRAYNLQSSVFDILYVLSPAAAAISLDLICSLNFDTSIEFDLSFYYTHTHCELRAPTTPLYTQYWQTSKHVTTSRRSRILLDIIRVALRTNF